MANKFLDYRKAIDNADSIISQELIRRLRAVYEIGELKEQLGYNFYDPEREEAVIRTVRGYAEEAARELGLDPKECADFIERVYRPLLEACRDQERAKSSLLP